MISREKLLVAKGSRHLPANHPKHGQTFLLKLATRPVNVNIRTLTSQEPLRADQEDSPMPANLRRLRRVLPLLNSTASRHHPADQARVAFPVASVATPETSRHCVTTNHQTTSNRKRGYLSPKTRKATAGDTRQLVAHRFSRNYHPRNDFGLVSRKTPKATPGALHSPEQTSVAKNAIRDNRLDATDLTRTPSHQNPQNTQTTSR